MPEMRPIGPHDPRGTQRLNALRKPHEPVGKRFIIKPGSVSEAIYFNEGFSKGILQRFILKVPDAPSFYMHKKHVGEPVPREGAQPEPLSAPVQDSDKPKKLKASAPAPQKPAAGRAPQPGATIQNTRITYILSQSSQLESDYREKGVHIEDIKEGGWVRIGPSNTEFVFRKDRPKDTSDDSYKPTFSIHRQGDWFYVHNSSKEEIVVWTGEDIPEIPRSAPAALPPAPSPAEVLANIAKRELKSPAPEVAVDLLDTASLELKIVLTAIAKNNVIKILPPADKKEVRAFLKKANATVEPDRSHVKISAFMNLDGEIVSVGPLGDQSEETKAMVGERKLVTAWMTIRIKTDALGRNLVIAFDNTVGIPQSLEDARMATEEEFNAQSNPYIGSI